MRGTGTMRRAVLIFNIMVTSIFGQLTLSEAMVNPQGLETANEFLEVYHPGGVTISLAGWVISDGTGTDTLIHWFGPDSVTPGQFALIMDPDYDIENGIYGDQMPTDIPIFTSGTDASLGSGGFTNSGESALLISPAGDTVSQFTWSASPPNGYSFEKILPWGGDAAENWAITLRENGTPGQANTVTPPPVNCSLDSMTIGALPDSAHGNALVYLHVHNAGLQPIDSIYVELGLDENQDSLLTMDEPVTAALVTTDLAWLDTLSIALASPPLRLGLNQLIARLWVVDDTIGLDDELVFRINLTPPSAATALNEIHYRPGDEQTEFIELMNTGPDSVNLQLWQIQDATSSVGYLPDQPLWLPPNRFAVIAPDQTLESSLPSEQTLLIVPDRWPSLNNGSDSIRISDAAGERLLTAWYHSSWGGGEGVSLERRAYWLPANDPENWGSSLAADGMTPGDTNSIVWPDFGLELNVTTQPEQPRRLDSILVRIEMSGRGHHATPSGLLQLTVDGMDIATEAVGIPPFSESLLVSFPVQPLAMGNHHIAVSYSGNASAFISDTVVIVPRPGDLIINEVMPWPDSGFPEWVEVANRLSQAIPLDVLGLSNGSNTGFPGDIDSIAPADYLVLAEFEPEFNCGIVLENWPRLTNSTGDVVLVDTYGNVLDSLRYESHWGISAGKSMERIWPDSASTAPSNWRIHPEAGTPCEINAATPRPVDLSIAAVQPDHPMPLRGQTDTLLVLLSNRGYLTSSPGELTVFWEADEWLHPIPQIAAFDTGQVSVPLDFTRGGLRPLRLTVDVPGDAIPENNTWIDTLRIGYPADVLTINEIAAVPPGDQPEYIELVNQDSGRIDLSGWTIRDAGQRRHPLNTTHILDQNAFIVLSANAELDSYFDLDNITWLVPGGWPTLNNTTDSIFVIDAAGHTVAGWFYNTSWGTLENTSLERRAVWLSPQEPENWGSSLAPDGGTPGLENSIAYPAYQVQIDTLELPHQNSYRDSLRIGVGLTTMGHYAESGTVSLLLDGFVQETQTADSIRFGQRTTVRFHLAPRSPGYHTVRIEYTGHSSAELDSAFWIGIEPFDLVINEIMPWPESGEPEWIEIQNRSAVTIPLNLVGLGDYSTVGWCDTTSVIAPNSLLTLSQEIDLSGCSVSPSPWPVFANQSDVVRLVDRTGRNIDSLAYDDDWSLSQGRSLERIWPDSAAITPSNWRTHPEAGTPCEINAATPLTIDLELTGVQFDTTSLVADEASLITFHIINRGYETSSGGKFWLRVGDETSTAVGADLAPLPSDSTLVVTTEWLWEKPGMTTVTAWLEGATDLNPHNDSLTTQIFIAYDEPTLILTEIMYLPASQNPEWIEIYNTTSDSIQINNWAMADASKLVALEADSGVLVAPGRYFVLQAPGNPVTSSALLIQQFPNLNNTGDFLGLLDPLGNWIDSLTFTAAWGDREGISLERIRLNGPSASPSNWGNAVTSSGSTPGEQNSLYLDAIPSALTLTISPNPFSPDDDGFEDIQTIAYTLPFESGSVSAEIFDVYGRRMATLAKNQPVAAVGELIWDGSWDFTRSIRMGIYILKFRADDHQGHVYERLVKTYVARR